MRKSVVVARQGVIAIVVAGFVLAGCGSSSKSSSPTTTAAAAAPKSPPSITIDAADFTFAVPSQIPAGYVNVTIDNHGKESHQVQFVKLGSMTLAEFRQAAATTNLKAAKPDTIFLGGPNGADPGAKTTALVNLEPGTYAVTCFIPAAADGKPHATHGMFSKVEVVKTDESYETTPVAASTIALKDFSFTLPPAFTGKGLVDVANQGKQVHELVIVKLVPGKTLDDAKSFLLTPPDQPPPAGPPPFTAIPGLGGTTGLSAGQHAWLDMNLTPGNYVLICFYPDTSNAAGLPHALVGMVKEFKIS